MTAASVSRHLRQVGFQPSGSANRTMQEGLRVTQSGAGVRVCADLNSERAAADLAVAARMALIGAGYVLRLTDEPAAFYVVGRS
jgi:hypothetical protein